MARIALSALHGSSRSRVLSGNWIALQMQELHRPLECRRFGQLAANFPVKLLLITFVGNVYRDQSRLIANLLEENRVCRELQGKKRPRLNDEQRRRLAAKDKPLGRRLLDKVAAIVTPDTIMRWHRRLIAEHHTYPHKTRLGRPGLMKAIRELIVRMETENSGWGYLRIRGELKKVGHPVAKTTIATTLKSNGIAPSHDRPTTWSTFLKSHADVIGAADFFTVDVWTKRGLVTNYVFFVIHHATRMVEIAGITANPDGNFMKQVARNLTDHVDSFLRDKKYLILDNGALLIKQFVRMLKDAGTKVVHTAIQAPDMNAVAERSVGYVKHECLRKLILFGDGHLQRALSNYAAHHHQERPHQGLGNNLIRPQHGDPPAEGEIVVDERLGGLFRSYRRSA
ncbi:MAG: putative transposase [Planctomycetota bacterium]|jgi:putative transposase